MCGRFTQTKSPEELAEHFGLPDIPTYAPKLWSPSEQPRQFNIAPTEDVIVVRAVDDHREAAWLRWGLLPHFAKNVRESARMINARAESVWSKPAFRSAIANRRCLVPATGFIEWRKAEDGRHPFHFVVDDGDLFAMAGIWAKWKSPGGETVHSVSILTTDANTVVEDLHDRMPVILPRSTWDDWLSPDTAREHVESLLVPYDPAHMSKSEISRDVNNVRNESAAVLKPA